MRHMNKYANEFLDSTWQWTHLYSYPNIENQVNRINEELKKWLIGSKPTSFQ